MSRSLVVAALAVVALAIAASFAGRTVSAATVAVEGGNNYFCSSAFDGGVCETHVTAGDTVTWTMSGGTHTVTQCSGDFTACPPAGGWDSGILSQGDTYSQTFASAGTYAYRCELHPSQMRGKIVVAAVTPSPSPVATAGQTNAPADGSTTSTAVALPKTGGASDGGNDATLYVALALGLGLVVGAALAFTFARRGAS